MSYSDQTVWSDPCEYVGRLGDLPDAPVELADCLENFPIHHAAARFLNFGVPDYAESDRNLRSVRRLLATALERDNRPLTKHRDLSAYLYGTCHDFALIAASRFRSRGIEARLRVGFVDYFRKDRWEDHWLCEYRIDGQWRLLDAQLGRRARQGNGIEFNIADVPRERFKSGSELWLSIRSGDIEADKCGLSYAGISGHWFPASNVLKDAATLSAIEPLPWDYWGPARRFCIDHNVDEAVRADLDALARAFDSSPSSPEAARLKLNRFPWAKPTGTVLSFVEGGLHEVPLA